MGRTLVVGFDDLLNDVSDNSANFGSRYDPELTSVPIFRHRRAS